MMLKQDGERVSSTGDCHLLLPHLWVLSLQEANLLESLTCSASDLVTFWKSQKNSAQMKQNPGLFESLDFEHPSLLPAPYILHGDAAPFTEVDSIQVISFRSMGCFRFFSSLCPSNLNPLALHGLDSPNTHTGFEQLLKLRRSLLCSRSVSESQLLLAAVPKLACNRDTFKTIVETLAWSFDSLYAGKCPKKDLQNRTVPYNRGKRLRPGIL